MRTHGMTHCPEYNAWSAMRNRCEKPSNKDFKYYGGRGITVCGRWSSFENFYEDMGPRPSNKHTIDRIDNDRNYDSKNCRWATRLYQARNRRVRKNNKSGTSGVVFVKDKNRWRASIRCNYKYISLGSFIDLHDAVKARLEGEKKYWGTKR